MSVTDEESKVELLREATCGQIALANQYFCSDNTIKRFLRARGWNVAQAAAKLRGTLEWRQATRPDLTTFEDIQPATVTGRVELLSEADAEGRPILLYRLRQKMPDLTPELQVKFLTYILESSAHVADSTDDGKACWLFDMAAYDRRNSPPLKVVRECINVFQSHFPERLGQAIVFQPNFVFRLAYQVISPFLDPVTRSKIIFIDAASADERRNTLAKHVPASAVAACTSDSAKIDVEGFARRMRRLDEERRGAYNAFCKAAGKAV